MRYSGRTHRYPGTGIRPITDTAAAVNAVRTYTVAIVTVTAVVVAVVGGGRGAESEGGGARIQRCRC